MGELRQDLSYALRALRRNPGFAFVVVFSLALGIGANAAIFSLVNAVLLRTLPVKAPQDLIALGDPARTNSLSGGAARTDLFSYPLYKDLRDNNQFLTGLAASGRSGRLDAHIDSASAGVEHPRGRIVSGNYFGVLGIGPEAGRLFDGSEDQSLGASPEVVISDGYWTRRFQRSASAIGREIVINGARYAIIGVAPRGFAGEIVGQEYDLWLPLTMTPVISPQELSLDNRGTSWLLLLGRIKPGVTLAQATAAAAPLIRNTLALHANSAGEAEEFKAIKVFISSGARGFSRVRQTYTVPLRTLSVGVALLMLIICANVANLLLARAVARTREMAVRLAIGAGRVRLVRQLLTESVVLGALSAAAGLAIAYGGSRLLLALVADGGSTIPLDVRLDAPVLGFTVGLTALAVTLFGLVPALSASRVDLATTMRASARSLSGSARTGRVPVGKLLVAGQVGLSVVLLVGAAMLVRSLQSLQTEDAGLDRDHLLIVDVDARGRGLSGAQLATYVNDLNARLGRIPGVAAVSYSDNGIFNGSDSETSFHVDGFTVQTGEDTLVAYDRVGPGYAHALGAHVLHGRDIAASDPDNGAPVALVNESFAKHYFGGGPAIGRTFHYDSVVVTIVGVIADTKDHTLTGAPQRRFYMQYANHLTGSPYGLRFEVLAARDPETLVEPVRRAIKAYDPTLAIDDNSPLSWLMRQSIREERLLARLASGFGLLALLLAAIGLYGVISYAVVRRTGEFGLRVALGAQRGNVIGLVLGDAFRLVALGLAGGVPLAIAGTRLLRSQLHGVAPTDPTAIGVALAVLTASAFAAALIPALRATRVDPLAALRED
jgi:predicted permease